MPAKTAGLVQVGRDEEAREIARLLLCIRYIAYIGYNLNNEGGTRRKESVSPACDRISRGKKNERCERGEKWGDDGECSYKAETYYLKIDVTNCTRMYTKSDRGIPICVSKL